MLINTKKDILSIINPTGIFKIPGGITMSQTLINFFSKINIPDKNEVKLQKFVENNFRMLLISSFLFVQQSVYALFVAADTMVKHIYLVTALSMFIFSIISLYFYHNSPDHISKLHKLYEFSIGLSGLTIAGFRIAFLQNPGFRLPTVYIAVIYGLAVIFYYSYLESFLLYLYGAIIVLIILPYYHPSISITNFLADTISNNIFAWIASMIIYNKFVKEFRNKKIIEEKNKKLKILSDRDPLTGIYNRRKIEKILNNVHGEAKRYKKCFSIILAPTLTAPMAATDPNE